MTRLLVICLANLILLAGCATHRQQSNLGPTSKERDTTINAYPDPGAFQLVEITQPDNSKSEFWQARGDIGKPGGTFRVSSFGSGPKTFNVWAASDAESSGIGYLMFERLVDTDAWTGKPYPRLAKSIATSPSQKEYTITLRRGLKWSDGHPLTADDVIYSFNTLVKGGYGNASIRDILSVRGQLPTIEKVDDLTVKFKTAYPFAPFLNSLAGLSVAPKHILQPITNKSRQAFDQLWSVNANPESMVVSGPFKLSRYVPGQRVEFVRNPHYHMIDKQGQRLPYLDKFVEVIVPDQNTQILKFYGNEIDFLDIRSIRGPDVATMKAKEKTGDYKLFNLGPDDGTTFLVLNMNRRRNPQSGKLYVETKKQKWFNNPLFRQAVSHALNRPGMVDNILRGIGLPLYTAESSASIFINTSLKPYPQDLPLAQKLLTQGGFVRRSNQLFDSEGNRVEFTLLTNAGNQIRDATSIMIVENLKKLGIKVNYQSVDFNILVSKLDHSLDWEAVVLGLTGSKIEPHGGSNVWKSNGRLHMFDQRLPDANGTVQVTDARDWEKQIDNIFDEAATTLNDTQRHQLYDQYQSIVYEQQPFIYLFSALNITGMKNHIGNYRPVPLGITYPPIGSLHNIEEIFIHKDKR